MNFIQTTRPMEATGPPKANFPGPLRKKPRSDTNSIASLYHSRRFCTCCVSSTGMEFALYCEELATNFQPESTLEMRVSRVWAMT